MPFASSRRHPIRTGSLGRPKRGFGRLALETGAAVLPVAVFGADQVRRGMLIRPRKVRVSRGAGMTFPRTESPSPALANSVGARIWPVIELQWEWLGGSPPLRKAADRGGQLGHGGGGAAGPEAASRSSSAAGRRSRPRRRASLVSMRVTCPTSRCPRA